MATASIARRALAAGGRSVASDIVVERRLAAIVIALVMLVASSASAQGADTVFLRNGGRLRGTVEVFEPGVRVVILLPDGSRRTIEASELDRVQFADAPSAPTPEAPPVTTEPATPPPAEPAPSEPVTEPPPAIEHAEPSTADALSGADLDRLQTATAPGAVGEYGDGHARDVAWNGVDPRTQLVMRPEGMLHLVVEGRVAFALSFGDPYYGMQGRFGGDLAIGADLRVPETILHVRAALVLGLQSHQSFSNEYAYNRTHVLHATGFGYVALRGLVGVDVTSWLSLRAGGEYGFEVLPVFDVVRSYGGPELGVVFRALDDRRLELGLALAVQDRSHAHVEIANDVAVTENYAGTSWVPRIALTIGGVFL
ncbi:hypothetical protein [Sandaracinus amylolyticus]|uniref:hypothetical protein n=1 Tax=Sandaracinus amylolyticus TaxID=927083 RepID=UPI001F3720E1|nr:hypothetical protein [Sandaracinus amylolyticus]